MANVLKVTQRCETLRVGLMMTSTAGRLGAQEDGMAGSRSSFIQKNWW
jgi:hypothetical protein